MNPVEIRVGGDAHTGRVLLQGFGDDPGTWHEEGLGRFRIESGRMVIDAREGGYSAFWKRSLPANLLVRYRVRSLPPYRQNNFNLISRCAPPRSGWPIIEKGRYAGYREFDNYISENGRGVPGRIGR